MGQLAAAVGVTPGTATTMVKTLAESGLVEYEPYAGRRAHRGGTEARRARAPTSSPDRALSRSRHGLLVGRGARRSRTARARRHRSADRSHRRDARTARDRSARRSDPERRRTREAAGRADAALLPARDDRHRHARHRSGQGVPALHRAAPSQAGRGDRRRSARRGRRQRPRPRQERSAHHDRHAGRVEAAGAGRAGAAALSAGAARVRADRRRHAASRHGRTCPATWTSTSTRRSSTDARLDFHRFVLLVTHSFSPRIRFVGELELEHAFVEGLEEAGELELEQAYVDFLLDSILQRARRA